MPSSWSSGLDQGFFSCLYFVALLCFMFSFKLCQGSFWPFPYSCCLLMCLSSCIFPGQTTTRSGESQHLSPACTLKQAPLSRLAGLAWAVKVGVVEISPSSPPCAPAACWDAANAASSFLHALFLCRATSTPILWLGLGKGWIILRSIITLVVILVKRRLIAPPA